MNALSSRTNRITELSREYPQSGRKRVALNAFVYFCAFYGLFALYAVGKVSTLVFGFVGIFIFIRYFDLTHEEMHTRQNDHRLWKILRWVFSISGPLQLGYLALAKNHGLHHAHQGTNKDPDLWIEEGNLLTSLFNCMTQPEQAVIRYYKDFGFECRFVLDTTAYLAIWGVLAVICTPIQFLVYNLVVRVGNGLSWWVFAHILHRQEIYVGFDPVKMPQLIRTLWIILIGRNNLNAITYHYLHHAYPSVPAMDLPELSRRIQKLKLRSGELEAEYPELPSKIQNLTEDFV